MPDSNDSKPPASRAADDASLGDVIDVVKAYAKQETLGPLKGAGQWLGFGFAGAFAFGLGLVLILVGILRLLQTEFGGWADGGAWSWAPYFIVLLIAVILLVVTIKRIQQDNLNKEPK